ncbi:MAG TPA: periplasmic heavy metal sensor, partial [Burkholderiales bacterium]|nr:periplasmic heavy metal sensor [Burkholderiales bacterium]
LSEQQRRNGLLLRQSTSHTNREGTNIMSGLNRNCRRIAMALALSAGLASLPVLAQPGPGRHMHQHGGLGQAIVALQAQLNLTPQQQSMLDAALASGKGARDAARQTRQTIHQLVQDELAKDRPDLAKIAAAEDQAQDAATAARRGVRNQLLQLYGTFTAQQVAVVKDAMAKRMSRMEAFRQRMKQRFGN